MNNPIPESQEDPALLNHLYISHQKYFVESMSDETKSRMIKDGLIKCAIDIIGTINKCFPDVKFDVAWQRLHPFQSYCPATYDKRWCDDEDYIEITQEDLERYYALPIEELGLEIQYTWERKCSLGHTHFQRRYHLFSSPQWLGMMSHWRLGPDPKAFVKEYFPDFFYEI